MDGLIVGPKLSLKIEVDDQCVKCLCLMIFGCLGAKLDESM